MQEIISLVNRGQKEGVGDGTPVVDWDGITMRREVVGRNCIGQDTVDLGKKG